MPSILSFDDFSTLENLYIDDAKKNKKVELQKIDNFNQIYLLPIKRITNYAQINLEIQLYMLCHVNFYIGLSSLLRQHLATTFNLLRVALDACFAAYILLEGVGTDEQYRKRDDLFRNARRTILDQRKTDANRFPKAIKLLKLHGRCSRAASHADYTTLDTRMFFHRAFSAESATMFGERLYFGIGENPQRFTASCWIFLLSHSLILNIFGDHLLTKNLLTHEEFTRLTQMSNNLVKKLRKVNVKEVRRDTSIKLLIDALLK